MGCTMSTTHPGLTSFKHKSAPLKSKNVVLLKPEIFSPKMKTPLRAGLCVEFERKNNDLNDINEIKEIKESLLNTLKIFHLFNLFRLFPYGLCRRDCKSSLSQREDLGGNVSMGVVSHLFFVALWAVSSGLQVLPFATAAKPSAELCWRELCRGAKEEDRRSKGGLRRECEYECECHTFFCCPMGCAVRIASPPFRKGRI